jgi:hypothetical protein
MRFALGAICLLIAAPVTFGACGGDEPSADPKIRYCEQRCACNKCSEEDLGICKDDIINLEDDAKGDDCKDAFDSYVSCLVNDGECSDGDFDESFCAAEDKALNGCLNPVPACMKVDDGVCNEPAPKGDGTCAAGSDTVDCMAPPTCSTSGNGLCDEPGGDGTDLCAQGSDAMDCACPYTGDGTCDEPEGTGYCVEGYDSADCMPEACVSCGAYLEGAGMICTTSETTLQNLAICACGASCSSFCSTGSDFCDGYTPSSACTSCMSSSCGTAYNACLNDKPAP